MSQQDLGNLGFEETLEELDADGNQLGNKIGYFDAHKQGLWHQSAHVWVFNKKSQVLLQKRGKKVFFAGRLDVSAAGHIKFGETPRSTALAELSEELGIEVGDKDLYKAGVMKVEEYDQESGWTNNEFDHVFLYCLPDDLELHPDTETEVESVVWLDLDQLSFEVNDELAKLKYVPHGKYYDFAIALIRQRLESLT